MVPKPALCFRGSFVEHEAFLNWLAGKLAPSSLGILKLPPHSPFQLALYKKKDLFLRDFSLTSPGERWWKDFPPVVPVALRRRVMTCRREKEYFGYFGFRGEAKVLSKASGGFLFGFRPHSKTASLAPMAELLEVVEGYHEESWFLQKREATPHRPFAGIYGPESEEGDDEPLRVDVLDIQKARTMKSQRSTGLPNTFSASPSGKWKGVLQSLPPEKVPEAIYSAFWNGKGASLESLLISTEGIRKIAARGRFVFDSFLQKSNIRFFRQVSRNGLTRIRLLLDTPSINDPFTVLIVERTAHQRGNILQVPLRQSRLQSEKGICTGSLKMDESDFHLLIIHPPIDHPSHGSHFYAVPSSSLAKFGIVNPLQSSLPPCQQAEHRGCIRIWTPLRNSFACLESRKPSKLTRRFDCFLIACATEDGLEKFKRLLLSIQSCIVSQQSLKP